MAMESVTRAELLVLWSSFHCCAGLVLVWREESPEPVDCMAARSSSLVDDFVDGVDGLKLRSLQDCVKAVRYGRIGLLYRENVQSSNSFNTDNPPTCPWPAALTYYTI